MHQIISMGNMLERDRTGELDNPPGVGHIWHETPSVHVEPCGNVDKVNSTKN